MRELRDFYDEVFGVEDTESFMSRSAPEWAKYATQERIRAGAEQVERITNGRKGGRLLDLGCGDGVALRRFRRSAAGFELVGADISLVALRKARAAVPGVDLVLCDANHLPFRADAFDVIFCTEVLEHVLEPAAVVSELGRVSGDSLVLTTPCFGPASSEVYRGWARRWNAYIRDVMKKEGVGAMLQQTPLLAGSSLHTGHVNAFTPSALKALIGRSFRVSEFLGVYFNFPLLRLAIQKEPRLEACHRALQSMLLRRIPLFCTFVGGDAVGNFEALIVGRKPPGGGPSP